MAEAFAEGTNAIFGPVDFGWRASRELRREQGEKVKVEQESPPPFGQRRTIAETSSPEEEQMRYSALLTFGLACQP